MKRVALLIIMLMLLFCGCDKKNDMELPEGATTIDGTYVSDELPVAYYFSKDGFGQQYIGNEIYQIRYYILNDRIYIENFSVDGGNNADFDVEIGEDYILIGGIRYTLDDRYDSGMSNSGEKN